MNKTYEEARHEAAMNYYKNKLGTRDDRAFDDLPAGEQAYWIAKVIAS